MSQRTQKQNKLYGLLIILIVFLISLSFYFMTAYKTIPWWMGCSFATGAITLGITPAPGSLLLTILGWLVTQLPLGISKIFALNLFAGVMAALVAVMVMLIAARLIRDSASPERSYPEIRPG